jgi:hypothetical protein
MAKRKRTKGKQWSTKYSTWNRKLNILRSQTILKTGSELMCSWTVSSSVLHCYYNRLTLDHKPDGHTVVTHSLVLVGRWALVEDQACAMLWTQMKSFMCLNIIEDNERLKEMINICHNINKTNNVRMMLRCFFKYLTINDKSYSILCYLPE